MTAVNYYHFTPQVLQQVSNWVRHMSHILYGDRYLKGQGFNVGPPSDSITPNYSPFLEGRLPPVVTPATTPAPATNTSPGAVISNVAPPSKDYAQNIVNYAKKFESQPGKFSVDDLSKLYGFKVTDQSIKNLDLDGNGTIDLNEAAAGLAFEDNNGAKADGKISSEDINATKSLFDQSVQGPDNEVTAKIGANKDTISKIDKAMNLTTYTN